MSEQRKTRPPTPAERHAARALGLAEPVEIVEDVTPTAERHAARVLARRKSPKPPKMSTADYYARRALGGDGGPDAA